MVKDPKKRQVTCFLKWNIAEQIIIIETELSTYLGMAESLGRSKLTASFLKLKLYVRKIFIKIYWFLETFNSPISGGA